MPFDVTLRPVADADLDALFTQMKDPDPVWMAAFASQDPADRAAFDEHMRRVRSAPSIIFCSVDSVDSVDYGGALAGSVASFVIEGDTEVTYWIDRAYWDRGIATAALRLLLDLVTVRPVFARAASDNTGSLRVLGKCGFKATGTNRDYASAASASGASGASGASSKRRSCGCVEGFSLI